MPIETEIKLRWRGNADEAVAMLAARGYRAEGPRELEVDEVYDGADARLRLGDQLLRLRSAGGRWTVTYKGPAARAPYKSREEIEVDVSDGAAFAQILAALGFQRTFHYEKYRTKFRANGQPGVVTLDETPIGSFLELEGPGYWIDSTASALGFAAEAYVTSSYAALYQEYCRTHGGVLFEMKFEE
jgi:adenylate cyclase class 2